MKFHYFSIMDRTKTVIAIRKRLQAVGCPFYQEENLLSIILLFYAYVAKQMIINIVCWLEDQCIRL